MKNKIAITTPYGSVILSYINYTVEHDYSKDPGILFMVTSFFDRDLLDPATVPTYGPMEYLFKIMGTELSLHFDFYYKNGKATITQNNSHVQGSTITKIPANIFQLAFDTIIDKLKWYLSTEKERIASSFGNYWDNQIQEEIDEISKLHDKIKKHNENIKKFQSRRNDTEIVVLDMLK